MTDIDYSSILLRAEKVSKPIYDLLCRRQDGAACLAALETIHAYSDLLEFLIRKNTKGAK